MSFISKWIKPGAIKRRPFCNIEGAKLPAKSVWCAAVISKWVVELGYLECSIKIMLDMFSLQQLTSKAIIRAQWVEFKCFLAI